jgi:hypothetical protein
VSRWVELYATTPSGKTLFVCRMCGRTSPAPDRGCPALPSTVSWKLSLACDLLEEIEAALIAEGEQEEVKTGLKVLSIGQFKDGHTGVAWVPRDQAFYSTTLYDQRNHNAEDQRIASTLDSQAPTEVSPRK